MTKPKDSAQGPPLSEELLKSLESVYSDATGQENSSELRAERDQMERILPQIARQIAWNYLIDSAIDRGGAGVVFKVIDKNLTSLQHDGTRKVYRALKVARPIGIREETLNTMIARELTTLASLTHSLKRH
ncbi:MAG: hypothetical protein WAO35_13180 [Terriglobia bacterium]